MRPIAKPSGLAAGQEGGAGGGNAGRRARHAGDRLTVPPRIEVMLGAGPGATPLSDAAMAALDRIEVRQHADALATFSLSFAAAVAGSGVVEAITQPAARVVIKVSLHQCDETMSAAVLIDGLVTAHEYQAPTGSAPGVLTISGADASVAMDMYEYSLEYPGMSNGAIVGRTLSRYAALFDFAMTPPAIDIVSTLPVPQQSGTDLAYLRQLAHSHGAVFRIESGPGDRPVAYWGPPKPATPTGPPLTVGAGSFGNVAALSFRQPAASPIAAVAATQWPVDPTAIPGMTASGSVDIAVYGALLLAPGAVSVRGAGATFDGDYAIVQALHAIRFGETGILYTQDFALTRGEAGKIAV